MEVLAAQADQDAAAGKRDAQRDQETKEYLEQLAQEKELSELERTQELAIAVRVSKGEISAAEAKLAAARELEEHAKNMTALAHKLELDLTLKNYDREQLIADAENNVKLAAISRDERLKDEKLVTAVTGEKVSQARLNDEIERIRIAREVWEAREWQEVGRRKDEIKNKGIKDLLDTLKDRPPEQVAAAFADDPQKFQAYLDYAKQQDANRHEEKMLAAYANMTEGQILAVGASKSPDAAKEAYSRKAEAEEKANGKVLDERRKVDAEIRADREKTEGRVFDLANKAVEHQTTVVPPAPVTNMQH